MHAECSGYVIDVHITTHYIHISLLYVGIQVHDVVCACTCTCIIHDGTLQYTLTCTFIKDCLSMQC